MDIRTVIAAVNTIQTGLAITSPSAITVKKVWKFFPPKSVAISDTPAFVNEWIFDREDRTNQGLREQYYTDHFQLLVFDADADKAADIATAFMEKIVDAFDAHETLAGAGSWTKLRGAGGRSPTLFPITWAGFTFVGLDLFLDIRLTEGKTYGL